MIITASLFRGFVFLFLVRPELEGTYWLRIIESIVLGLRFDVQVFGFLLIPIYIYLLLSAAGKFWKKWSLILVKIYLLSMWTGFCFFWWINFHYFQSNKKTFYYKNLFSEDWTLTPQIQWTLLVTCFYIIGIYLIKKINFRNWKDQYSPDRGSNKEIVIRILIPFVLLFLACRGNLMPRHLNSDFVNSFEGPLLRELALNPWI